MAWEYSRATLTLFIFISRGSQAQLLAFPSFSRIHEAIPEDVSRCALDDLSLPDLGSV